MSERRPDVARAAFVDDAHPPVWGHLTQRVPAEVLRDDASAEQQPCRPDLRAVFENFGDTDSGEDASSREVKSILKDLIGKESKE